MNSVNKDITRMKTYTIYDFDSTRCVGMNQFCLKLGFNDLPVTTIVSEDFVRNLIEKSGPIAGSQRDSDLIVVTTQRNVENLNLKVHQYVTDKIKGYILHFAQKLILQESTRQRKLGVLFKLFLLIFRSRNF